MEPVRVEVITYTPTAFYHCQHCELTFQRAGLGDRIHQEQAKESLPPELLDEFRQVSDWIHRLTDRHGSGLKVTLIDAASVEGLWKAIRYRVRRFPAVVVSGRHPHTGIDFDQIDSVIDREIERRRNPVSTTEKESRK